MALGTLRRRIDTRLFTVSQRGVVFFRKQDGLTDEGQKELMQRLGELSGRPSTSRLHIHPIYAESKEARAAKGDDDEINIISSRFKEKSGKVYAGAKQSGGDKRAQKVHTTKKQSMKTEWHSDIAFEHVPADYTMLRLTELPPTGGGKFLAQFASVFGEESRVANVEIPQIRCGLPDTRSMTASPHRTRSS